VILYLDTSALVKLYVRERGSVQVKRHVTAATHVASSRVAYPEARAALARRHREGGISARGLRRAVQRLDTDWPAYVVIEVDDGLARRAGTLAETRALRAFDAIHVASAIELAILLGQPVAFLTFDGRQVAAAGAEGLQPP
jgi:uncharacterized protein